MPSDSVVYLNRIESLETELALEVKRSRQLRKSVKELSRQRVQLQESLEVATFRLDFCYTTLRLLRKDYPHAQGAAWTLADRALMESALSR